MQNMTKQHDFYNHWFPKQCLIKINEFKTKHTLNKTFAKSLFHPCCLKSVKCLCMILKTTHEVLHRKRQTILVHLISFNCQHPLVSFTAKTMAAPPQNRTGLLIHHTLRCQTDNHETSNKCQPF